MIILLKETDMSRSLYDVEVSYGFSELLAPPTLGLLFGLGRN
jgi:hypothetical protein